MGMVPPVVAPGFHSTYRCPMPPQPGPGRSRAVSVTSVGMFAIVVPLGLLSLVVVAVAPSGAAWLAGWEPFTVVILAGAAWTASAALVAARPGEAGGGRRGCGGR